MTIKKSGKEAHFKKDYYTYELPPELIAQHPLKDRDSSRMMVLDRENKTVSHHAFTELPPVLPQDSVLVINNSEVIPARLRIVLKGGGKGELLLLHNEGEGTWRCLAKPSKRIRRGDVFSIGNSLTAEIIDDLGKGQKRTALSTPLQSIDEALEKEGEMPLPPYIKREQPFEDDWNRYQTVYASCKGSAAAPTAGFHFTHEILDEIEKRGIDIEEVTLHVGTATFLPVRADDIRDHHMHTEYFEISKKVLEKIKAKSKKVIAIGTTSVRTLESAVRLEITDNEVITGETDMFIFPGFEFQATDILLTNFHLPESTLLMLVCAFAGRDFIMHAYEEAIKERYRFYSYGDCMLIL